ncbi:J domain-containing protein [Catelliglobosispora koreensis]|uniref:J domain-containing protein n=1 Tax=Catelliglobosispora koreensis TaxID=129052 RepID=UPI00037DEBB2|nr:DnaJ domain-containing protein [Catelliglobosispora koreensis]
MIPPWIRDLDGADPYEVLGVDRQASQATISQAYLKLIKLAHPDLPTGDEEQAKLLGLARDILTDPVKRADYNRFLDTGSVLEPSSTSAWDDEDITSGVMDSPVTTIKEPGADAGPVQPSRMRRYGLGLAAFGAAFVCGPVGLVMAVVALTNRNQRSSSDRLFALLSLGVGLAQVLVCCLAGDALLSTLDPAND